MKSFVLFIRGGSDTPKLVVDREPAERLRFGGVAASASKPTYHDSLALVATREGRE